MADPFRVLPLELVCLITQFLKPSDIWRLRRVSKDWQQILIKKEITYAQAKAFISQDSSRAPAPTTDAQVSRMLRHCTGLPYGLVHIPAFGQEFSTSMYVPQNMPDPILTGHFFAYGETQSTICIINLQNGQAFRRTCREFCQMVLTTDVFAILEDDHLSVDWLNNLDAEPAVYSLKHSRRMLVGDKHLLATEERDGWILIFDARDGSKHVVDVAIPCSYNPADERTMIDSKLILDAERRFCYLLDYGCYYDRDPRRFDLFVVRVSIDAHSRESRHIGRCVFSRVEEATCKGAFSWIADSLSCGEAGEWAFNLFDYGNPQRYLIRFDERKMAILRTVTPPVSAIWKDTCYVWDDEGTISARNLGRSAIRGKIRSQLLVQEDDGRFCHLLVNGSFLVYYSTDRRIQQPPIVVFAFDRSDSTCPMTELQAVTETNDGEWLSASRERTEGLTVGWPLAGSWEELLAN